MKNKKLKYILFILLALLLIGGSVACFPLLKRLGEGDMRIWLVEAKAWFDRFGVFKYLLVLLLQILQVIVALIPGEPVEIFAGYLCGTFGGLLLCEIGVFIGTAAIWLIVTRAGKKAIEKVTASKTYDKLKFLHREASKESVLFLLFFIPGTPKDALTYFSPLLKIDFKRLAAIILIARVPSIITSTYVGATLSEGNIAFSILVFSLTAFAGAVGIIVNDLVIERRNKKSREEKDGEEESAPDEQNSENEKQ